MMSSVVGLWSSWIAAVTWQLAALAVVALVCEKALRLRQPRVRHALWWFVLVAPLVLGPGRMALERMEAVVRVAPPVAVQAVTRVHVPVVVPVERVVPQAAAPVPEVAWWSGVRAMDVLGLAWVMGCLMLVARLVVGHARARRLVSESRAVDDEQAGAALAELCAEAGVRQEVGLRVSSSLGAPVLYGVRRPTILLPEDWVESLEADDLRALLAHEVAHVRRGDCLANLIQRIVEIPLFFHPGAWLASRGITLSREESADAWALARGVEASSYARSLTAAAERAQVRVSVASVGVAEGRSTLLRRVEAIMRGGSLKRMSRPLVVALIGAALVSAGAFAAVQVRGNSDASVSGEVPLTAARSADLTASDTEAALQAAGIRMQRYDYDAPFPHYFTFTFEQYVDGRRVPEGGSSESQLGSRPDDVGRQSFLLTTRDEGQQDSRAIAFQFSNDAGSVGGRSFSLKGHDALSYGALTARLRLGEAVPIYALQANLAERGGIRGAGSDASVAYRISHYDMVVIVYAELHRTRDWVEDDRPLDSGKLGTETGPSPTDPRSRIVYDTIDLKFMDATYVAWLFGKASLAPYLTPTLAKLTDD